MHNLHHVKATKEPQVIQALLEVGFEFVCRKAELMFFQKAEIAMLKQAKTLKTERRLIVPLERAISPAQPPLFGPIWGFNREAKNSHISLFRFLKSTSGIRRKPDKDRAATTAKSVKSKNTVWNTNCRAGV